MCLHGALGPSLAPVFLPPSCSHVDLRAAPRSRAPAPPSTTATWRPVARQRRSQAVSRGLAALSRVSSRLRSRRALVRGVVRCGGWGSRDGRRVDVCHRRYRSPVWRQLAGGRKRVAVPESKRDEEYAGLSNQGSTCYLNSLLQVRACCAAQCADRCAGPLGHIVTTPCVCAWQQQPVCIWVAQTLYMTPELRHALYKWQVRRCAAAGGNRGTASRVPHVATPHTHALFIGRLAVASCSGSAIETASRLTASRSSFRCCSGCYS